MAHSSHKKPRLLFVVNVDWFFESHRLPIALAALQAGFDVHVACAVTDRADAIENTGIIVHKVPLSRGGTNPIAELRSALSLAMILYRLKPDVLHAVTIKPVLYCGMLAHILRPQQFVCSISGLGSVFSSDSSRIRVIKFFVAGLYRIALHHARLSVIFQNETDRDILQQIAKLLRVQTLLVSGSGVDLNLYAVIPTPPVDPPVFVIAARLILEKGILEFLEAARLVHEAGYSARFVVAGKLDPSNPHSMTSSEMTKWKSIGAAEFVGHVDDIPKLFAAASVVVLPSYYGEGFPKVLMEAAAAGRAVITTDHPGCRDAIISDKTGILVQPRNVDSLFDAFVRLIRDPALVADLGNRGRELARQRFSIEFIVKEHLQLYANVRRMHDKGVDSYT